MSGLARVLACATVLLVRAAPASAHPVPFSYLDVRIASDVVDVSLVMHVIDVAHELGIDAADTLLEPAVATPLAADVAAVVARRLALDANGSGLAIVWDGLESLPDRQAVRLGGHARLDKPVGRLAISGVLFPYDRQHRTFVNVYEADEPTQAIIDAGRTRFEYFAGTRQGALAVVEKFVPAGVQHILIGPDHILFLIGLLLLGGTVRRLAFIVTGFTLAHSITLSLAVLNVLSPPARIIEPAIALSIIFVGADNLTKRDGRDIRAWIAVGFGFIHGFGFANVLREMDLPARALGWSLFSFNVGVEIGQLAIVVAVATALAVLRSQSEVFGRRLAFAGSVVVIAVGSFWFAERTLFPGGL
jgi:hydrogenase/urease accessory protein HupE